MTQDILVYIMFFDEREQSAYLMWIIIKKWFDIQLKMFKTICLILIFSLKVVQKGGSLIFTLFTLIHTLSIILMYFFVYECQPQFE